MKGFKMSRAIVLLIAVLSGGYAVHAWSQGRLDVRPAAAPIPSASSNGVSFAWFYDAADRTVYVCRAGAGVPDGVDCKAKTQLP